MTIATYNIRNNNQGDSANGNGWGQRVPVIASMVLFHDFDIMGTQEGKYKQLEDLSILLPEYAYIGVGRDDGKQAGEYSAIFYKTDRFKLIKEGNFWLSENTEEPSLGWDAVCIRICTWGEFEEIKTGFRFHFFNLHMDHIGTEARKQSAILVMNKIKELAGSAHTILSGDFNIDQHDESYLLINNSEILKDAYDLANIRYETNGTFNNFNPNSYTTGRIDHVFLSKDFSVSRYGILTDSYRSLPQEEMMQTKETDAPQEINFSKYDMRMPSDHFPVVVKVRYSL